MLKQVKESKDMILSRVWHCMRTFFFVLGFIKVVLNHDMELVPVMVFGQTPFTAQGKRNERSSHETQSGR